MIRQDPSLRIDQVGLPYTVLVITQKAQIENILHRMYNISYQEAYDKWYRALAKPDPIIVNIIQTIIDNSGPIDPKTGRHMGIPVIINRNPSINYGSILMSFCVKINLNDYTMSVPLQILRSLAADFDGDVLNIFFIINQAFFERAFQIFNPRNAMYISRSNGMLNSDVLVQRDTLINANTLEGLTKDRYTEEELAELKSIAC